MWSEFLRSGIMYSVQSAGTLKLSHFDDCFGRPLLICVYIEESLDKIRSSIISLFGADSQGCARYRPVCLSVRCFGTISLRLYIFDRE